MLKVFCCAIFAFLAGCSLIIPLEKQVKVTARLAPDECIDKQFPILVVIFNDSHQAIESMAFEIHALRIGYSNYLESERHDTDKIIEPAQSFFMCVSLPRRYPAYEQNIGDRLGIPDPYVAFSQSELEYKTSIIYARAAE